MTAVPPAADMSALKGLKVVECATVVAAPLCGRLMADFGAEVIHVEHPKTGDHLRQFGFSKDGVNPWWKYYARNKQLVTLDIGKPAGRDVLLKLAADADVLIENFRPGRMEAWGLGWDVLHELNPRLVMVRVTGYGQTGPYASQPGFGTLMEAMSGFAEITGEPDGPPTLPQYPLADTSAAFYGALATMFAIYNRDVVGTGQGQVVDVSIWESLYSTLGPNAVVHALTGVPPRRTGNRTISSAPRNTYLTKDGKWVALAGSTQSTAVRLFNVIGRPDMLDDPRFATNMERLKNHPAMDEIIGPWIAARTRDEVIETLRANEVPVGPVYNIADIEADPHAQAREMVIDAPDGDGRPPVPMEGIFPKLSATPGQIWAAGREMGADNEAIYKGRLGLSDAEFDALKEAGII
jgi:crotonobetainyl-CoA:carnitine CoA-transferase CaiB-like acyl-CoA transferase